jgi:hypothetical protein
VWSVTWLKYEKQFNNIPSARTFALLPKGNQEIIVEKMTKNMPHFIFIHKKKKKKKFPLPGFFCLASKEIIV